jgi:hydrogenase small subunit
MQLTRRDFLRASSALSAAFGLRLPLMSEAEAAAMPPTPPVVWLQAQSCSGCSVSLLNTIYYMTAADLLTKTVSMRFHSTVMAAAGANAVAAAQAALNQKGYILVVEGAIPTGSQANYCFLWPGMNAMQGVRTYAANAAFVIAAGSCSAFGGVPAARPNPTTVRPLSAIVGTNKLINIPGCPIHPDWLVGTVAYLLANNKAPSLDSRRRPKTFYPEIIHEECPYEEYYEEGREGGNYGPCRFGIGCKGPKTVCDCNRRRWNGAAANTPGVNWCMASGSPCLGCTEPGFPDGMSPFYTHAAGSTVGVGSGGGGSGGGGDNGGDDDHESEDRGSRRTSSNTNTTSTPTAQPEAAQPEAAQPEAAQPEAAQPATTPKKPTAYQQRQTEKRQQYEQRKEQLRKAYKRAKLEK